MVRSNFDYTNRPSNGPKLGASIASDFEKKAAQRPREAKKATTARRSSRVAKSQEAAGAESETIEVGRQEATKLDIKIPGKALTDDGFVAIATKLHNLLEARPDHALTDLDVSGNILTTRSLGHLAPAIRTAHLVLQSLNISNNSIKVDTEEQMHEWETFLLALNTCRSLRRVDLSGNPKLGILAFETLARVYIRQRPIDPLPEDSPTFIVDLQEESRDNSLIDSKEDWRALRGGEINNETEPQKKSDLTEAGILPYRDGLQALPYLILHNVDMTDSEATFLATILRQHRFPSQLIAVDASTQSSSHEATAKSSGLVWTGNEVTLTKDGITLLQRAEKVRKHLLPDGEESSELPAPGTLDRSTSSGNELSAQSRRLNKHPLITLGSDDNGFDMLEFDQVLKKCQRNIIVETGLETVPIWRAAMEAFLVSRRLFMLAPPLKIVESKAASKTTIEQGGSAKWRGRNTRDQEKTAPAPEVSQSDSDFADLSLESQAAQKRTTSAQRSYAASLAVGSGHRGHEPVLAITDVTNTPTTPQVEWQCKVTSKTQRLKAKSKAAGGRSEETNWNRQHDTMAHLQEPIERQSMTEAARKWQQRHMASIRLQHGGASDGYRDMTLQCQLPLPVCLGILKHSMAEGDLGLLSKRQQMKAFEWGQMRESLSTEYDWRNKDKSAQIWMLLEAVEGLAYE